MLGFRVWDKANGKMYEFGQIVINRNGEAVAPSGDGDLFPANARYIPMQSTGLKDYKGVEIFEGDIIEYDGRDLWANKCKKQMVIENAVEFISDWGRACLMGLKDFSVIGNKYQNPNFWRD